MKIDIKVFLFLMILELKRFTKIHFTKNYGLLFIKSYVPQVRHQQEWSVLHDPYLFTIVTKILIILK